MKDDALFAGLWTSIAAAPATAQQTPQTYCAGLGASACEVLNVELGGYNTISSGSGVGLIKYCRNGQFSIAPLVYVGTNSTFNAQTLTSAFYLGIVGQPVGSGGLNKIISGITAGGSNGTQNASNTQSWSSTTLCSILP